MQHPRIQSINNFMYDLVQMHNKFTILRLTDPELYREVRKAAHSISDTIEDLEALKDEINFDDEETE